jgi:molybdenum cofactor biosynthesis enzyme MoaA
MLDAETARLMKEAGFATIRISLETVAPERQADWDDKVRYDEFLRAVAYLKEAGFAPEELGAYVMAGLPGETFEEAARNVAAVHAAGVPVRLAQYSPIPGTAYFERARASAPVDITEPLLQNNTAVPLLDRESYRAHDRLKALAQHLNDNLAAGRILIGSDRIADARALRDLAEGAGA